MQQPTNSTLQRSSFDSATQISSQLLDILAISGHLPVFWASFHYACAETAIPELPVKILLTASLDSATPIFQKIGDQRLLERCNN